MKRSPTPAKTKVFHFILDHRVGGPHVYVRNLSRTLATAIESRLVTTGRGDFTDIALFNLRHRLRWLYPLEVVANVLALLWRFRGLTGRAGIIFDVHGAANLAPVVAARMLGVPLVWHFHETVGGFSALANLGKRLAAGIPHRYVIVAARAGEVFRLPAATLIAGAVDAEFWSPEATGPRRSRAGETLRILAVGNLNPLKGADVLLDALATLAGPWELVIVGAELQTYLDYADRLRAQASLIASAQRQVRFAGWQSPEEVRRLLVDADVFVLPSRSEACPLALLEAMACGCACIATDVGDVRAIIEAAGCGIVIPGESPAALGAALAELAAAGEAGRQRIGRRARETVVARHSLREQAAKHLAIYTELASSSEGNK